MQYSQPLVQGKLIKRYKRFLADIALADGSVVVAHCANTGAMTGCAEPGATVWLSKSDDPKRKTNYSWQLTTNNNVLVGINTAWANKLVFEAINQRVIKELIGFDEVVNEPKVPHGRLDFLLKKSNEPELYIEVKSVTLAGEDGVGYFPDAVSQRATKHLAEMVKLIKQGYRCCLFFCVQRGDFTHISPADHIDKNFGIALRDAVSQGLEVLAYQANVSPKEIRLTQPIPVIISPLI